MTVIQVVGKSNFYSEKKKTDYFVLHTIFKRDGVQGYACEAKFVSSDIFNKAQIDHCYGVIYDVYSNGRGFISDIKEVQNNN